jgi:hypothetical protein
MKAQHIFFLLLFSSLLLNSKCRKDNEPQLPPETTIGANTFGCKIDGKVFIPQGRNGMPGLVANQYFLGTGPGGGWFTFVTASDKDNIIIIETDSLLLLENNSYSLKPMKGFAYGRHYFNLLSFQMNQNDVGTLFITKHDMQRHILSGRFSFTATNVYDQTKKVNITEGRFDIIY